jgi:hypothetical protein
MQIKTILNHNLIFTTVMALAKNRDEDKLCGIFEYTASWEHKMCPDFERLSGIPPKQDTKLPQDQAIH